MEISFSPFLPVVCMDCKILVDDNAEYRQKELLGLVDSSQQDEMEVRAAKAQLNYIRLFGNIGCMGTTHTCA